ncbi:hypothetical protein AQUCO_01300610v1 [Aquilegia coerulea]|uniref:Uncharacterized protein n=1 Tax=Aquilegia coerulea TaxID=218851 RepID=A0A2G5E2K1_AQUCA|nr:hypothetical protein AQUCO_01300610v1 [Aquilegia coerulea]
MDSEEELSSSSSSSSLELFGTYISWVHMAISAALGILVVVLFYLFRKVEQKEAQQQQLESKSSKKPDISNALNYKSKKPLISKKPHSHASVKGSHHPLDVNTLKGHGDSVTGLCFSSDGRNLATDGVVRLFKLDDASSKSFKFLRINLPAGSHPTAITFSDEKSSLVVAAHALSGSSLYMYGEGNAKTDSESKQAAKLPLPEIKWEHHKVHDKRAIINLVGTTASFGTADGSTIIASCSEGTDIILWHGKTGKILGNVDTNQLKNHMATVSPNGRFIAAAAFTADVKVWEIVYSKDGSVKEVTKAMQLKGHKSAVTWLCFTQDSEQIITASKDGSIRVWNINVRYHMDEDPKTLKVFPIPLHDSAGSPMHYDRLTISPDGRILAATHGTTLQWLCVETGKVLDTAEKAHEGEITGIAWAPKKLPLGGELTMVLATSGTDKKVKLWAAPVINQEIP